MMIARFLQLNDLLPLESLSLGSLIEYYGIKVEGVQHEAKYDALATVEVYKCMAEVLRKLKERCNCA